MAVDPSAQEFALINQMADRIMTLGFKWRIWKSQPNAHKAVNRWDVCVELRRDSGICAFGNDSHLPDAIVMACENLFSWIEKNLKVGTYAISDVDKAQLMNNVALLVKESKRLPVVKELHALRSKV
jgi:hypothetical protein